MNDEHAWYLTELGERAARMTRLEGELERWKNRVRELEDAILVHQRQSNRWKVTGSAQDDHTLWAKVEQLWT